MERLMPKSNCVMHLHLWLETEKGLLFGPGHAELLECIERLGSLRKAADDLGMSYRAAWGKIKRTEEALGFKLIDKAGSYKEATGSPMPEGSLKSASAAGAGKMKKTLCKRPGTMFSCKAIKSEDEDQGTFSGE